MSLPFFHPSHSCRNGSSGLTLIEMLVVLTIFIIMTAVVMANFPAFRDKTALQLIAQEIATTIRQAQVYGIGTRAAGTAGYTSHGIYFDLTVSDGDKSFILFADKVGSTLGYDAADQTVEKFVIHSAAKMIKMVNLQGCNPACSDLSPKKLNILFQRFYPEASFPGLSLSPAPSFVKVVVKSTRGAGEQREIWIRNTGQISVKP